MLRRIRRKGVDLSNFSFAFLPGTARFPLQRTGTDPVPRLAEVRAADPVHRLQLPFDFPVHLVSDHALAREVLADHEGYSNDIRHLFGASDTVSADDVGGLGFTDPPLHTRLRRIVTPEFTRRRLLRLQPAIEEVVTRRLDALEAAGPGADLAREVSFPVPFTTICELLGLQYEDRDAFSRFGGQRFDATVGSAAFGAVSAQRQVLLEAIVRQRKDPGAGLIGEIIRNEGDTITDVDLAGLADGIFTGGYETTAGMISLGVIVLLRDPAHAELVRSGTPEQVDRVVEELLRYLSVVQVAFPRFAKRDTDLGGHRVRAGDAVLVSLSGANRDPASAGADPDGFDPFRIPTSGHLAFGHGAHRCIGAELARMELRTVLPALLRRFPHLALAVPQEELAFRRMSFVYGVGELPVTW
ncbi:cytochrome P450 [Motilibacter rhizosphaerae]|uniref:cytochrome P450 n=1 Tax=Motilibacter rhizosphaerae TaxID=598652 RepID=UPI001E3C254E|nr:cytochrome P450 [Motilibacter rhizosphaerae]